MEIYEVYTEYKQGVNVCDRNEFWRPYKEKKDGKYTGKITFEFLPNYEVLGCLMLKFEWLEKVAWVRSKISKLHS
jgi:hypothetical protein